MIAAWLSGLDDHLAPWAWSDLVTVGSRSFESMWNWKVMVENWIECYHHVGPHRESIEPYQPASATSIIDNRTDGRPAPRVAMTVESIEGLGGPPETWIPGLDSPNASRLSVWSVFPLLLGGALSREAFWLQVIPTAVDRHQVIWHLLAHRDQVDRFTDEVVAHELDALAAVHAEDIEACLRVQAGLASGLFDGPRFVDLEQPVADFHRWVIESAG